MNAVTIACDNWDPLESYGQLAAALARCLAVNHGLHVNAVTGPRPREALSCPVARGLLERPRVPVEGGIVLGYPPLFDQYGPAVVGGPRLAVTMFESTALPAGWTPALEQCAAIVVPSPWLVEVFRAAGVTRPIHVIPLGVSTAYRFVPRPARRRPFTFLVIAAAGLRKGWDVAVRAFAAAFGEDPAYRLVIKIRAGRRLNARIMHPQVEVLATDLEEVGMQDLYASVDAFVCPSRGEGFGLPPREAAATGLPVIATAWGGTADHIDEWGIPLASSLTTAWPHHRDHPRCGQWAEPDVGQLAALMQRVANHGSDEDEARQRSLRVTSRYSWDHFATGVWEVWQELANLIARPQPAVVAAPTVAAASGGHATASLSPGRMRPKVVIHARAEIPWHGRFVAAAAEGLRAAGVPFAVTERQTRGDIGLPLLLGTTFWRAIEADGPYLLVDRCSFGDPGRFVSLVRDGHGRRGDHRVPEHIDAARWERHGVPVEPWSVRGERVILCGQTETYAPRHRRVADWYDLEGRRLGRRGAPAVRRACAGRLQRHGSAAPAAARRSGSPGRRHRRRDLAAEFADLQGRFPDLHRFAPGSTYWTMLARSLGPRAVRLPDAFNRTLWDVPGAAATAKSVHFTGQWKRLQPFVEYRRSRRELVIHDRPVPLPAPAPAADAWPTRPAALAVVALYRDNAAYLPAALERFAAWERSGLPVRYHFLENDSADDTPALLERFLRGRPGRLTSRRLAVRYDRRGTGYDRIMTLARMRNFVVDQLAAEPPLHPAEWTLLVDSGIHFPDDVLERIFAAAAADPAPGTIGMLTCYTQHLFAADQVPKVGRPAVDMPGFRLADHYYDTYCFQDLEHRNHAPLCAFARCRYCGVQRPDPFPLPLVPADRPIVDVAAAFGGFALLPTALLREPRLRWTTYGTGVAQAAMLAEHVAFCDRLRTLTGKRIVVLQDVDCVTRC